MTIGWLCTCHFPVPMDLLFCFVILIGPSFASISRGVDVIVRLLAYFRRHLQIGKLLFIPIRQFYLPSSSVLLPFGVIHFGLLFGSNVVVVFIDWAHPSTSASCGEEREEGGSLTDSSRFLLRGNLGD